MTVVLITTMETSMVETICGSEFTFQQPRPRITHSHVCPVSQCIPRVLGRCPSLNAYAARLYSKGKLLLQILLPHRAWRDLAKTKTSMSTH